MSDEIDELLRPEGPRSWRDRLAEWAEALDLSSTRLVGGVAVLVVAVFAGWRLLTPPAPPTEMRIPFTSTSGVPSSAALAVSTTTADVVVHVAGAVNAPGVQRLATGARVVDAVSAAGGPRADADVGRINLAALLEDGQQVYVPAVGEAVPHPAAAGPAVDSGPSADSPIDINEASLDELDELPGIGPALAQAIVSHREQHGPFASVDELLEVRGIGEAKLDQIRPLVTT